MSLMILFMLFLGSILMFMLGCSITDSHSLFKFCLVKGWICLNCIAQIVRELNYLTYSRYMCLEVIGMVDFWLRCATCLGDQMCDLFIHYPMYYLNDKWSDVLEEHIKMPTLNPSPPHIHHHRVHRGGGCGGEHGHHHQ